MFLTNTARPCLPRKFHIASLTFLLVLAAGPATFVPAQDADELTNFPPEYFNEKSLNLQLVSLRRQLENELFGQELLATRIEELVDEVEKAKSRLSDMRSELSTFSFSSHSYKPIRLMLESKLTELEISQAGLAAQREEILRFSDETTNKDAVAQSQLLQQQVKIAKQLLSNELSKKKEIEELYKTGALPAAEVMNAKTDVLEAEMRLAEIEGQASQPSPASPHIQKRLLEVSIESAMCGAQIQHIKSQLAIMNRYAEPVEQIDTLQSQRLPFLMKELASLRQSLRGNSQRKLLERRIAEIERFLESQDESRAGAPDQ